ncbi:DUF890 domain protein [Aspergillus alliaceus]|uniref:DUF890 domain protein n=1 Tax=Petromyces alliaceus TaxID=209559 RepID=A0A5N6FVQ0_PETAA|nr:DUF890 domain protein [Aspergillus alliaceus]KAB8234106.1 DUF890 domain protein [Aspergillus alliaceus]KAE8394540.1 DUF890 domain protein [Aspergillus alliaceus]
MRAARNNIYKDDVDFATLARQSPEFAKYLKRNNQLDFGDPDAVRQLTKSLLQRDFNLKVHIPENRLCPPVPNRFNYILWLQRLLDTTGNEYRDDYDPDRKVVGLDIGTGCCSIYPLLGCAVRPQWKFVATDIDDDNIRTSQEAVSANELDSRIRIIKTDPSDSLISLKKLEVETLDFTMCNPPFYVSREELVYSAQAKKRPPFSTCTGAEVEVVTQGGEVAFVSRMIEESLHLRERVSWYTSMLGKLSSVTILVEKLIEHDNHNYAVTEFVQGSKTRRWAIAWSWGDLRPSVDVARSITTLPRHLLPFPSEFIFDIPTGSIDSEGRNLDNELTSLPLQWVWRSTLATGAGFAMGNVWSRQARRKMKGSAGAMQSMDIDEKKAALGFKVLLRKEGIEEKGVRVLIRWLKGTDPVLFESFCGMVKRKLEGR